MQVLVSKGTMANFSIIGRDTQVSSLQVNSTPNSDPGRGTGNTVSSGMTGGVGIRNGQSERMKPPKLPRLWRAGGGAVWDAFASSKNQWASINVGPIVVKIMLTLIVINMLRSRR